MDIRTRSKLTTLKTSLYDETWNGIIDFCGSSDRLIDRTMLSIFNNEEKRVYAQ